MQERLETMGIICRPSPPGNLSVVSNIGFEASTTNKVIITDSDTVFSKNCVRKMIGGLNNYDVVELRYVFGKNMYFSQRKLRKQGIMLILCQ